MSLFKNLIITSITLALGFSASAESLSPLAHLNRCYAHLTGRRIPFDHSLVLAIKNNEMTSSEACTALMDRVMLKSNGMINDSDAEILKDSESALNFLQMQDNTKISARDFCTALPDSGQYCDAQFDVFDANTPGLVLTEALLNPLRNFSEIFTFNRVPRAEREYAASTQWPQYSPYVFRIMYPTIGKTYWNNAALIDALILPDLLINTSGLKINIITAGAGVSGFGFTNNLSDTISSWAPRASRIKAGSLKGIVYDNAWSLRFPASANIDSSFKVLNVSIDAFDPRTTVDQNLTNPTSQGSGVIGSREYLMLNFGWGYEFAADGVINTPRRWSQAVFKDFFCRPMPAVRNSDATPFVISSPHYTEADIAKAAPFRLGTNCVSCHMVMDQLAGVLRDVTWHRPAFTNDNNAPGATIQLVRRPSSQVVTTSDNSAWRNKTTSGSEALFWKRQPIGQLVYRSYDGRYINLPVQNLKDLSAQISQLDDPYVCAAKNYFKQFTGLDVSLHDVGDPASAAINAGMTSDDWAKRNYVINLGLDLKRNGKASEIVKKIMTSTYFKSAKGAL